MKRLNLILPLLVIVLLLFSVSCKQNKVQKEDNYVIVAGEITNPIGDSASVDLKPVAGYDFTMNAGAVDKNGNFYIKFKLDEPVFTRFNDGNETTRLFLRPDDSIYLTINTEQFDETVKYTGTAAAENNYLAAMYLQFMDGPISLWELADSVSEDEYTQFIDSIQLARKAFFADYNTKTQLDKDFTGNEAIDINYQYPNDLWTYIYRQYYNSRGKLDTTISDSFYEKFGSYYKDDPAAYQSDNYNSFISNYARYLVYQNTENLKESDNYDSARIVLLARNLNSYAMQKVLASDFYSTLNNYNIDKFEAQKDVFDKYITDPAIKEILKGKYNDAKEALAQGIPEDAFLSDLNAPENTDITYSDIIDKYKGKVIYLDFWASWCGPCKSEMKYSPAMKEKLHGKDVAFVYFSTDRDSLAWERMIKILQISGDHYRLSRAVKKEANDLFDVRYIPRYILIDKEGNAVDTDAKRPSNPETVSDIEGLL